MNIKTALRRFNPKRSARDPVALTALLYLREAVLAENYEICNEIIQLAYEFGAAQQDVFTLLEDPRRQP